MIFIVIRKCEEVGVHFHDNLRLLSNTSSYVDTLGSNQRVPDARPPKKRQGMAQLPRLKGPINVLC